MPCSHCGQVGHTYLKCPQLTPEQIKEKKEAIKKEKEEKIKKKKMRERHSEIYKNKNYTFFNDNMYEVAVYWAFSNIPENDGKERDRFVRAMYIPAMEKANIQLCKLYRLAIFPVLEVPSLTDPANAKKVILINEDYPKLFKLLDIELINYPDTTWELKREYKPPKSELEQWKEFGLKANYLLREIQKMTTTNEKDEDGQVIYHEKYENIEPFLAMVEDIPIPHTCTEADKEKAGIPSALTNIT